MWWLARLRKEKYQPPCNPVWWLVQWVDGGCLGIEDARTVLEKRIELAQKGRHMSVRKKAQTAYQAWLQATQSPLDVPHFSACKVSQCG